MKPHHMLTDTQYVLARVDEHSKLWRETITPKMQEAGGCVGCFSLYGMQVHFIKAARTSFVVQDADFTRHFNGEMAFSAWVLKKHW